MRNQGNVSIFAFVILTVLLTQISIAPATATVQESYNKIYFGCEAKGHGLVMWGLMLGPTISFGTYEYHAIFDEGTFGFAGTSEVEVIGPPPPGAELMYVFKEGTAYAAGILYTKWTHNGDVHELKLVLWSTKKTLGAYAEMQSPPSNYARILEVGIDKEGSFDPMVATLNFLGIYEVNGVRQIISGKALAGIVQQQALPSLVGVNLWINELQTYAQILWYSPTFQLTIPAPLVPQPITVTVPAANIKTFIKLI